MNSGHVYAVWSLRPATLRLCTCRDGLLNRDFRALLTLARQMLYTLVEDLSDRLEELNAGVRQVYLDSRRNPEKFSDGVHDLLARARFVNKLFACG